MADEIRVTPATDGSGIAPPPRVPVIDQTVPAGRVAAAPEPSLGELFKQLAAESSTLIKQEIALAKTEMSQTMSRAATDAVMIAVWGAMAMVGALVLVAFLVLLLGDLLDNYWVSALIVGALFTVVGGALAMTYVNKLKQISYAPETTISTLKQDKAWAQAEVQQVKRDLTT